MRHFDRHPDVIMLGSVSTIQFDSHTPSHFPGDKKLGLVSFVTTLTATCMFKWVCLMAKSNIFNEDSGGIIDYDAATASSKLIEEVWSGPIYVL